MSNSNQDLRAAWERMTPEQREALIEWFYEAFEPLARALGEAVIWVGQALDLAAKKVRRT